MARKKIDVNLGVDMVRGGVLKSRPLAGFEFKAWEIHELVLENGRTPVTEFLDGLEAVEQDAFLARFEMMLEGPPFKQLNTFKTYDGLWQVATHNHRILGIRRGPVLLLLTNGFKKTRQQTPKAEIDRCKDLKAKFEEQDRAAAAMKETKGGHRS